MRLIHKPARVLFAVPLLLSGNAVAEDEKAPSGTLVMRVSG